MQKFITTLSILLFTFFCTLDSNAQKLDHIQGEVLVEVRNDSGLKNLLQDLSSNSRFAPSLQSKKIMSEPMNLWVIKTDPNEVNEIQFLNTVIKNNHVLQAQRNHITQLRAVPNDPQFGSQWQFINNGQTGGVVDADIDMDLAWDLGTGGVTSDGDTIVVCVVDDGVNLNHPDFGDNLWINNHEIPGNEIDDDGNGYIDDIYGWNAFDNNNDVMLDGDHGTIVAGIVGAKGNNGIGVSGVLWDVKVMNVRGEGPEALALAAYAYPYTMRKMYNESNGAKGAFVVSTNASWGVNMGQPEDAPIWCDFYNMLGEVGILNIGATINSNLNVDEVGDLPTTCGSNYLVSVTNMNKNDEKVNSAGFGKRHIDLGAFGQQVYSMSYNSYGNFGGTSAAAPQVAGVAALLYSADCPDFISLAKSNPSQAALVVKDCILHGVEPNESLLDRTSTGGRLNAHHSMQNLIANCGDCTDALGSNVENLSLNSGVLTWYDNDNVGNTSFRYKRLMEEDWTVVENIESGYQLNNLSLCTSYEFQTKTVCPSNPNADYTYSRVFKTEGCCDVPEGISISINNEVATIVWGDVLAASNFILEWRPAGEGATWTPVNIGLDNTYELEGIEECKFFEIRIKSQCDITNNESDYSAIFNINGDCEGCTREFCSFTAKKIVDEWIDVVEIEDVFINESGVDEDGYGNYLGKFDIDLQSDQEYTINLTPGHTETMYDEYFSAYIDFNQDGEFEDDESIFISEQATNVAVSGTFIAPSNAKAGVTRMRVVMRFNELNGPCDDFQFEFGEIEDYCVFIINDSDCSSTFEAKVIDTMETSLTFEVLQNDLAEFYVIAIREKDSPQFDIITSQLNEILIPNLTECTTYEYSSGYICDGQTFIDPEIYDISTLCVFSNDNIEEVALSIFPNPSYGDLNIEFENPYDHGTRLELISNDGKIVLSKELENNGDKSVFVDASHVPVGVYFLKVLAEEKMIIRKWVKY